MTDQPVSPAWTDADDRALTLLLIMAAYNLATASEIAERRAESMARHPAGRATHVPMVAPPMPDYSRLGTFIAGYAALLLILAGFLVGITQHFWVAFTFVLVGCALGVRLATVQHRQEKKS